MGERLSDIRDARDNRAGLGWSGMPITYFLNRLQISSFSPKKPESISGFTAE
jgi:hypothetical protein